MNTHF